MAILAILLALTFANIAPTVVGSLVAKAFDIGVSKIDLGVWRPKFYSRLGQTLLSITPWQIASSFTLKDYSTLDSYPDTPGRCFGDVNPLLRFFIVLTGPIFLLAATAPILGAQIVPSFMSGFSQALMGALSPLSQAQDLLSSFWSLATAQPVQAVAVAVTKLIAFALLPIPPNAGGNALLYLARWRHTETPTWLGPLQQLGMLAILAISASWVVAVVAFMARGGAI